MLVVTPGTPFEDARVEDLGSYLLPGDLVVVNDAATLPGSLRGVTGAGTEIEARLAGSREDGTWHIVLFGAGDWRTPTEARIPPPTLRVGDRLTFTGEDVDLVLAATVVARAEMSPRLLTVRFDVDQPSLWSALYALGRPIQYAYLKEPLALWSVQTAYAARPWAVELPSAGRPLSYATLRSLRGAGVHIATVTHAAGLSSTGDPCLDAALPLPERFEVPAATLHAIAETKRAGGRVIAVGTSVVRALEASADLAGSSLPVVRTGVATLRIGGDHQLRVVDGLLTGVHVAGESHYDLLSAFVDDETLAQASRHGSEAGYLCHEFGDATLIMPAPERAPRVRSDSAAPTHRSRLPASWT